MEPFYRGLYYCNKNKLCLSQHLVLLLLLLFVLGGTGQRDMALYSSLEEIEWSEKTSIGDGVHIYLNSRKKGASSSTLSNSKNGNNEVDHENENGRLIFMAEPSSASNKVAWTEQWPIGNGKISALVGGSFTEEVIPISIGRAIKTFVGRSKHSSHYFFPLQYNNTTPFSFSQSYLNFILSLPCPPLGFIDSGSVFNFPRAV